MDGDDLALRGLVNLVWYALPESWRAWVLAAAALLVTATCGGVTAAGVVGGVPTFRTVDGTIASYETTTSPPHLQLVDDVTVYPVDPSNFSPSVGNGAFAAGSRIELLVGSQEVDAVRIKGRLYQDSEYRDPTNYALQSVESELGIFIVLLVLTALAIRRALSLSRGRTVPAGGQPQPPAAA